MANDPPPPDRRLRGFAAMDPVRRAELASQGGRATQAAGKAHRFTGDEARAAGRKGGLASRRKAREDAVKPATTDAEPTSS